jgi:OmpA-OmpF porin, OOP family
MLKFLLRTAPFATLLFVIGCASTASQPTKKSALDPYVISSSGGVVRNSSNECVRTGSDEPIATVPPECGGAKVASAPPAPQPPQTTQAPPAAPAPAASTDTAVAPTASAEAAAAPAETAPATTVVYIGADTYFPFNQAELSSDAKQVLEPVVERAREADGATIRVVGHADQIGSDDYNMQLSQRRADAVRTYMVDQGVPPDAVQVEARGESDPIIACENQQGQSLIDCLQVNRRTEIVFSALQPVDR